MTNDIRIEHILSEIDLLFGNTTVSKDQTLSNLRDIEEHLSGYIFSIEEDIDNENDND
jgi:hypothetical protein